MIRHGEHSVTITPVDVPGKVNRVEFIYEYSGPVPYAVLAEDARQRLTAQGWNERLDFFLLEGGPVILEASKVGGRCEAEVFTPPGHEDLNRISRARLFDGLLQVMRTELGCGPATRIGRRLVDQFDLMEKSRVARE